MSTLTDGSPQVTVYIESKSQKPFIVEVCAEDADMEDAVEASVTVDGNWSGSRILRSSNPVQVVGPLVGNGKQILPFIFTDIKLVSELNMDPEEAAALLEEQNTNGVPGGKIQVEFWSFKVESASPIGNVGYAKQLEVHKDAEKGNIEFD